MTKKLDDSDDEDIYADDEREEIYANCTKKYYDVETFRLQVKELVLGYIDQHNRDCDDEIMDEFQVDLYADAAVSTIKHKFGPNYAGQRKTKIEASDFHVNYGNHYCCSDPLLLEKAGESYDKAIGHMAKILANNMKKCKYVKGGWADFKFHQYINIDRGTQANPRHVRNVLLYYVKKILFSHLDNPQEQTEYTNDYGIKFDFTEYFIYLGQELYHLVIRCNKAHIWNYHHSDCWFVIRAFQAVSKAFQQAYDIQCSPDVMSDKKGTPYYVFENCSPLNDADTFDLIQKVIFAYCRKQGLKKLKMRQSKFVIDLELILSSDKLYDEEHKLSSQGTTAKILSWCYWHLTPRSISRFESVFFVGVMRWKKISTMDYFYKSESDKQDINILPEKYRVPFYTTTKPLHEILLRLASSWSNYAFSLKKYPWIPLPMPSCIGYVSAWESIFQYD